MEINLISGVEDLTNEMGIPRKCAKDKKQPVQHVIVGLLDLFLGNGF